MLIKIHLGCTHVKETILIRQVSDEVFTKSLLSEHPTINDDEFDILLTGISGKDVIDDIPDVSLRELHAAFNINSFKIKCIAKIPPVSSSSSTENVFDVLMKR